MKKYLGKVYLPAFLGTAIEYYDIALYGYMAPILIQVFLPHLSKVSAYLYYFFFEVFAALFQVGGARFFGKIGDARGRKKVLYHAMLGTSVITFIICLLPTYQDIGIGAVLLFVLCRSLQSFFLGGEYNGGAIYCLEHETNTQRHGFVSGLYCSLTVVGIILAALVSTLITFWGKEYFRLAYVLSFLFALLTYVMRRNMKETPAYLQASMMQIPPNKYPTSKRPFMLIVVASIYFGMIYGLPTRIFNALLPLATGLSSNTIMVMNTTLLIVYMILLTTFGRLADRIGYSRLMRAASMATVVLTYPLILLIETNEIVAILLSKTVFFTLTAAFIGPFHAWTQELFSTSYRYAKISTAYSLGKVGSTSLLALSILLFDNHNSLRGVSFILILPALLVALMLSKISTTMGKEKPFAYQRISHSEGYDAS
jgi:MHS family proline/betaine transporter-like MFS transporter